MGIMDFFSRGKHGEGGDHWGEQRSIVEDNIPASHWASIDDRRYEAVRKLAKDRKWLAIFFALTTVGATGSAIYYAGRPEIQTRWFPYDRKSGDYSLIETQEKPDVPDIVMQRETERFIKCVFMRSFDPNVNNECTLYVRRFIGKDRPSYDRVAEWYKSVEGDGKLRWVEFLERPQQATGSKYTYRAKWKMDVWDKGSGALLETRKMVGELTLIWRQPQFTIFNADEVGFFGRNFVFSLIEEPGSQK